MGRRVAEAGGAWPQSTHTRRSTLSSCTVRIASHPGRASLVTPGPQDSYLSDVYDFYMKHLEDEAPISDFK